MKQIFLSLFALASVVSNAQNFTPGNLVVSRVGDGVTALSANSAPITLLEFPPVFTAVASKTLSIPATGAGRITVGGTAAGEGQVSLSQNGNFLSILGYDQDPGTASAVSQLSTNSKVVGRIDNTGAIDATTRFPTSANGGVRNAFTDDGTRFWTGINNFGYVTLGQTTLPVAVNGAAPSRTGSIIKNQLYSLRGFSDLFYTADPLPTAATTTPVALALSTRLSSYGFVFFDMDGSISWNGTGFDLVYLTNAFSGLEKYYFDGAYWKPANSQYNIALTVTNGGSGYGVPPTITLGTAWLASTAYALNDQVTNAGRLYTVTVAGTSGTTAPTHTSGGVVSGTATFTYVSNNATATAILSASGAIDNVGLTFQSGYLAPPVVTITSNDAGSGAVITATIPNNSYNGGFGSLSQLTGRLIGGVPVLYAIRGGGNTTNNDVIAITDNRGRTEAMTSVALTPYITIANAGANYAFRGVSFSPGTQVILPVTLTSFRGSLINDRTVLQWTTSSEINAKEFTVEKSSNGTDFSAIGSMAARNNNQNNTYSFDDANLLSVVNYYRLKLVDKSGSFKYSNVVVIKKANSLTSGLTVFPNPVVNNILVGHTKAVKGALLKIVAANGKTIAQYAVAEGAVQTSVDASGLKAGQYFINYISKDQRRTISFLK